MPPLQVTPDSFGFLPLAECRRTALRCTEPDFTQLFPAPGLVVVADGGGGPAGGQATDQERSFKRTVQDEGAEGMARYRAKIGFVAKRPGNPFPTMISIGRALNSDVVLALDSVSKIHGFFTPGEPGEWWLTDLRSTNGITINGARVERGAKARVADGDTLGFGPHFRCLFLTPAALHGHLVGARPRATS